MNPNEIADRLLKLAPFNKSETIIGRHGMDCGCALCAEVKSILAALRAADEKAAPTPESLNALAAWFDDPKNPRVFVEKLGKTPGYLIRLIATAMEKDK